MRLFLLSIAILIISCDDSTQENSNYKSITISTAENALLSFDRMLEFESDSQSSKLLSTEFEKLGILQKGFFPGFKTDIEKLEQLEEFIEKNRTQLFLSPRHEFISLKIDSISALTYLKDNKKNIQLTEEIQSISKKDNDLIVHISKKGVLELKQFIMQNINKTLLIEVDGNFVSAAKALGNFKSGILTLPNINPHNLK